MRIAPRVSLTSLAQSTVSESTSTLEWEWPYVWTDWVPILLLVLAVAVAFWFTHRDTRRLSRGWTAWLVLLRLSFLGVGIAIAMNPHMRTQTDAYRPSRAILLVDTSTSMQQPESDPRTSGSSLIHNRTEAIAKLLAESSLIEDLRAEHSLDLYTFDSDLSELRLRLPSRFTNDNAPPANTDNESSEDAPADQAAWEELLRAEGHSTRLGDALDKLLIEARSPTLSGVVVVSDGASNAGRDVAVPRDRAQSEGVRLVAVGVGSTEPPVNLEVARLIAPTDVQKGDSFELSALLRGQGIAGRNARIDLLQQGPNDPEPAVVYSKEETLGDESSPTEVVFDLKPADAGTYEFTVRATLPDVAETREDDNVASRSVNIFDRPLKVLVLAGGPMRDYHFSRTSLFRHPSMEVDVWLQTGQVGISQEADRLLFRFPEEIEDLYAYDAVLAFDPDWSQLQPEELQRLADWISNEGGGLVLVAGDVHTPELAADPELETVRKLSPVLFEEVSLRLGSRDRAETPYPVGLTQEGQVAEFLRLEESGEESVWEQFPGVYRAYPTRGPKAGATIYAEFTDPLSRVGGRQPILLAGHRYGQGQVLYLGSPETWRLRALDESYFDRFWVKLVRKGAEGRSKRGLQRSMFVLDGREFTLGQTVPLRLRSLNPQFQPLETDNVTIDVFGPTGRPILPEPELLRDRVRPSEFVGDFRPLVPGRYRLEYEVPDSSDRLTMEIDVQMPRQEAAVLVQDVETLERLVEGTGGAYLSLEEAAAAIPPLLPNKGEYVVIDQQIKELWDRQWLMLLLALFVSAEWLTRKLLKLA
jgi:uncharacterized membrane protein